MDILGGAVPLRRARWRQHGEEEEHAVHCFYIFIAQIVIGGAQRAADAGRFWGWAGHGWEAWHGVARCGGGERGAERINTFECGAAYNAPISRLVGLRTRSVRPHPAACSSSSSAHESPDGTKKPALEAASRF